MPYQTQFLGVSGKAKATINDNRLEITVGSQTLIVSLPEIIGVDSMG